MPPWPLFLSTLFLCLLSLLALLPSFAASSSVIQSQTVSYCTSPKDIIVDHFDLRYSRQDSSLYFDISAASVTQGLNLTAQLSLVAYGIHALDLSIDLCSVLSGVLCPLPTYNFSGSGQYAIPSDKLRSIPNIAWLVPDLEAVFRINFISSRNSSACLDVTLSNSVTVGLPAVVWSSASIAILSSALALFSPLLALPRFSPYLASLAPPQVFLFSGSWLFLLFQLLQNMALTGVLSLNYPSVLRTWSTNFAYSLGLIHSPSVAQSIDHMRLRDGGDRYIIGRPESRVIGTSYSPYNLLSQATLGFSSFNSSSATSLGSFASTSPPSSLSSTSRSHPNAQQAAPLRRHSLAPRAINTLPVLSENLTSLDPGMASYVEQLGFPAQSAFMTSFIWSLVALAIITGIFAVILTLLALFHRFRKARFSPTASLPLFGPMSRSDLELVAVVVSHRLNLVLYPPLTLFTFYQWKLGSTDAWSPILLSVLVWMGLSLLMVDLILKSLRMPSFVQVLKQRKFAPEAKVPEPDSQASHSSLSTLPSSTTTQVPQAVVPLGDHSRHNVSSRSNSALVLGFLKDSHQWVIGPMVGLDILRLAFLGFGQGSGQTQVIAQMIIGVLQAALVIITMPFQLQYTNQVAIMLLVLNVIQGGLMECFVLQVKVKPIPRAVIGLVVIVIHAIGFLLVFGYLLVGIGRVLIWFERKPWSAQLCGQIHADDEAEKGKETEKQDAPPMVPVEEGRRARQAPSSPAAVRVGGEGF